MSTTQETIAYRRDIGRIEPAIQQAGVVKRLGHDAHYDNYFLELSTASPAKADRRAQNSLLSSGCGFTWNRMNGRPARTSW